MDENVFDRSDVDALYGLQFFDIGGAGDLFNTQDIALGDIDGDDDLDVITANADQENRFYENTCDPVCIAGVNPFNLDGVAIETGASKYVSPQSLLIAVSRQPSPPVRELK